MRLQDTDPGTKFRSARVVHDARFVLSPGRERERESFHFRRERAKVLDPIAVALSLPTMRALT